MSGQRQLTKWNDYGRWLKTAMTATMKMSGQRQLTKWNDYDDDSQSRQQWQRRRWLRIIMYIYNALSGPVLYVKAGRKLFTTDNNLCVHVCTVSHIDNNLCVHVCTLSHIDNNLCVHVSTVSHIDNNLCVHVSTVSHIDNILHVHVRTMSHRQYLTCTLMYAQWVT